MTLLKQKFILLFSVLAFCAQGATIQNGGIYYLLNTQNRTASVTNRPYISDGFIDEADGWMYFQAGDLYTGKLVIPETIVEDGITYVVNAIGENAFAGCRLLQTLQLSANITDIGYNAFSLCYSLQSININNQRYFTYEGVVYEHLNPNLAEEEPAVGSIIIRAVPYAISGHVHVHSAIHEIDLASFQNCHLVDSITLPDHIQHIKDAAFDNCMNLRYVHLPESLVSMGRNAFSRTALTSIYLPPHLAQIGHMAFDECYNLDTIYNASELLIEVGSETHGRVAYYATEIINGIIPPIEDSNPTEPPTENEEPNEPPTESEEPNEPTSNNAPISSFKNTYQKVIRNGQILIITPRGEYLVVEL